MKGLIFSSYEQTRKDQQMTNLALNATAFLKRDMKNAARSTETQFRPLWTGVKVIIYTLSSTESNKKQASKGIV